MKSLILSVLAVAFLSACTDNSVDEYVKYHYIPAKVLAVESWCNSRYCSYYGYNAGLITPENEALIIKRGSCSKNPEDMRGKDVQVLKTEKTTQDGKVVVKYDLCI